MRKLLNEELGRLTVDEFKASEKLPVTLVLDNIRSQNNIGSIFRTADAFRVGSIILCGITSTPPHREIHKTALGATDSVEWSYRKETAKAIAELKKEGYRIISVEQSEGAAALDHFSIEPDQKLALVFGHEIRGVDQKVVDMCDGCLVIPQYGTKHSFNVSVAAGIVLWEVFRHYSDIFRR